MQPNLEILLRHSYLSRKQVRELQADLPGSLPQLRAALLQRGWMDPPDWKEAQALLLAPVESKDEDQAPDSANAAMQRVQEIALRIAGSDATALLLGESGVGKSRLAQLIHRGSARRNGPFVTVACGSIPETLLESELFGVERGAYTGATRSRAGRFLRAQSGTIFLDEIGELSAALQVKLLRVLQERRIEALGAEQEIEVDVRLIATTHRNLEEEVRSGRFREDLYFRLNVVPLTLPPLRQRPEDVLPLAQYFLGRLNLERGQSLQWQDRRLDRALSTYSWPGNIRELENCIERLAALAEHNQLSADHLPPRIFQETGIAELSAAQHGGPAMPPGSPPVAEGEASFPTLRDQEMALIQSALQRARGNIQEAARLLGVHRNTLARKLDEYGFEARRFKAPR